MQHVSLYIHEWTWRGANLIWIMQEHFDTRLAHAMDYHLFTIWWRKVCVRAIRKNFVQTYYTFLKFSCQGIQEKLQRDQQFPSKVITCQNKVWTEGDETYIMINLLKPSGKLYVPPGLTLKNSTWCPHCVYVFCTDLRTNSNFCLIKH
jgi:hypothetical protein